MTVYATLYNSCIHESSAKVLSLHATKAGAWKAMQEHKRKDFIDNRNRAIRCGKFTFQSRAEDYNSPHEWWGIRSYDVEAS